MNSSGSHEISRAIPLMRSLPKPSIDDAQVLDTLAVSRGAKGRSLVGYMQGISERYRDYSRANGDPWAVLPVTDFDDIAVVLRELYDSPTMPLDFVAEIRSNISGSCPMCGGGSLGTLDHYLPRASYSEFSFYSMNLVPCCGRCNNKRGVALRGVTRAERPLHPYFDAFTSKRLMTAEFTSDWRAPQILPIAFGVRGKVRELVSWHIREIVQPAGIVDHFLGLWSQLCQFHGDFIGVSANLSDIRGEIARLERIYSRAGQSPNAWDACFWHGLARNPSAMRYILSLM